MVVESAIPGVQRDRHGIRRLAVSIDLEVNRVVRWNLGRVEPEGTVKITTVGPVAYRTVSRIVLGLYFAVSSNTNTVSDSFSRVTRFW